MKILITGNGFDLAHDLPTSYKDFICCMREITKLTNTQNEKELDFNVLFPKPQGKAKWHDAVAKHYNTANMKFDVSGFAKIKDNAWYCYFEPIQTILSWIDFEKEIGNAISVVANYFDLMQKQIADGIAVTSTTTRNYDVPSKLPFLSENGSQSLEKLGLFIKKGNSPAPYENTFVLKRKWFNSKVEPNYEPYEGEYINNHDDFYSEEILKHLLEQLDEFIELFAQYLHKVVGVFYNNVQSKELSLERQHFDSIYTFNYTPTAVKYYGHNIDDVDIHYLHGKLGEEEGAFGCQIVLGISNLGQEQEATLEVVALGFTKYFQAIFKECDAGFLDEDYLKQTRVVGDGIGGAADRKKCVYIWGHSLDKSDEKYILQLFDLFERRINKARDAKMPEEHIKANNAMVVYYHDETAKAQSIKNLLAIVGKDRIEKLVYGGFLKFEPSPSVWKNDHQILS